MRRAPFRTQKDRPASWKKARRVVAKVEHHQGELFPRVGFIVTNLSSPSRSVVRFYNKGGTAEQWIKEGKQAAREGTISRRRNNRKRLGDNHWVRKAKMEFRQGPPLDCIVLRLSQFRCGLLARGGSLGSFQLSSWTLILLRRGVLRR